MDTSSNGIGGPKRLGPTPQSTALRGASSSPYRVGPVRANQRLRILREIIQAQKIISDRASWHSCRLGPFKKNACQFADLVTRAQLVAQTRRTRKEPAVPATLVRQDFLRAVVRLSLIMRVQGSAFPLAAPAACSASAR